MCLTGDYFAVVCQCLICSVHGLALQCHVSSYDMKAFGVHLIPETSDSRDKCECASQCFVCHIISVSVLCVISCYSHRHKIITYYTARNWQSSMPLLCLHYLKLVSTSTVACSLEESPCQHPLSALRTARFVQVHCQNMDEQNAIA